MGKGYRQGRLAEEIRKIVSEMLLRELKRSQIAGHDYCDSGGSHF